MKSYYNFIFSSTVFFIKGFKCVTQNWKTQKKAAEILQNPKNSLKICQHKKKDLAKF